MRLPRIVRAVLAFGAIACTCHAAPVVLHDGLLGTPPNQQGWAWLTDPVIFPQAGHTTGADAVSLNSMPLIDEKAGWFANFPPIPRHPLLPTLDRDAGYRVEWELRTLDEAHVSPDRAGWSLIVLGDDLWGIEVAFWRDEVWIQTDVPLFTHGEGAPFDTTSARTRYTLLIAGDGYELFAGGVSLLRGALRNYAEFGSPYDIPDFLFVGDDTSRGAGRSELARVEFCAGDASVSPGGTLRLAREGSSVRLEVADTAAAEYRVHRDGAPQSAGSTVHVSGPSPSLLDMTSVADGGTWYFVASAVDDCGFEHD